MSMYQVREGEWRLTAEGLARAIVALPWWRTGVDDVRLAWLQQGNALGKTHHNEMYLDLETPTNTGYLLELLTRFGQCRADYKHAMWNAQCCGIVRRSQSLAAAVAGVLIALEDQ